jgi:hypothetical protein
MLSCRANGSLLPDPLSPMHRYAHTRKGKSAPNHVTFVTFPLNDSWNTIEATAENANVGRRVMKVKINRDVCPAQLSFCERCLGRFLQYPMGYERRCFEELVDDGSDELTIEMHSGGHDVTLHLNEEQRRMMAGEGWAYFVDFPVPMYRNKTPEK